MHGPPRRDPRGDPGPRDGRRRPNDDAGTGHRLANAWLDRAYSWWLDDNPIAIAAGATQGEAINRRENESVNWLGSPVSSTSWLAWKYRT